MEEQTPAERGSVSAAVELTVRVKGIRPVTCPVGEMQLELSAEGGLDEAQLGEALAAFLAQAAETYRAGGA